MPRPTLPPLRSLRAPPAACLAAALHATPADGQEFRVNAEPAVAFPVDAPQTERFQTAGMALAIRLGVSVGRYLTFQGSYAPIWLRAREPYTEDGAAHLLSAGLRLHPLASLRPEGEHLGGLFIDGDVSAVRTGPLNRFGFDVGLGYDFRVTRGFTLGPVVRYVQIVQPNHVLDRDPNDAQLVTAGLNIGFGTFRATAPSHPCPEAAPCPQPPAPVSALACPDADNDGVCDADDRCPTHSGPRATAGCPINPCSGAPLTVLVQFQYDSSKLPILRADDPQTMDPVLDAVAAAIAQDPSCRVCVIGYASQEGTAAYNNELSVKRASAVQGYLAARGVDGAHIPAIGLGESYPLVPLDTDVMNRRVDFIRLDEGQSCPAECPK